jgi:uncharacterized protein YggT (Ycf19 family)
MGSGAHAVVLADAVSSVQRFVTVFIWVYTLLLLAYILLSWFRLPYSVFLERVQRFLHDVCDPYLRIFRRVLPPLGPIDFSPIVAIVVLGLLNALVNAALDRLK